MVCLEALNWPSVCSCCLASGSCSSKHIIGSLLSRALIQSSGKIWHSRLWELYIFFPQQIWLEPHQFCKKLEYLRKGKTAYLPIKKAAFPASCDSAEGSFGVSFCSVKENYNDDSNQYVRHFSLLKLGPRTNRCCTQANEAVLVFASSSKCHPSTSSSAGEPQRLLPLSSTAESIHWHCASLEVGTVFCQHSSKWVHHSLMLGDTAFFFFDSLTA